MTPDQMTELISDIAAAMTALITVLHNHQQATNSGVPSQQTAAPKA